MNLPAKYSRRSLQPFQHNDLSPAICPCERFLHGCPTERAEPPHDVLHHPGSLLVDEPHRQQQYGLVAGILYVTQPPQELRAFGRFERRVGDDVLAAEIYLLKPDSASRSPRDKAGSRCPPCPYRHRTLQSTQDALLRQSAPS